MRARCSRRSAVGGRAVVGGLDLRHRHAAVALAAEDGAVLEDRLGDVRLADRRAHHPRPVPGRHLLDEAGGGDVGDDRALPPGERGLHRERQGQLLGEGPARLVHEAQPLAVGVEHEAEVGPARPHHRPRLGRGGDRGLGEPREGERRVVVDRQHLAAEVGEPPRDEARAGAVAAVHRHPQPPRPDRRDVEAGDERLEVVRDRVLLLDPRREPVPAGALDRALVEDVEELLPLDGAQVEAVAAHELERVPLRGVVAAGDRDAALRARATAPRAAGSGWGRCPGPRPRSRRRGGRR